ncbi:hypothetical protein AB6A40_001033 [Gnathostoma spinigerum]|uniref:Elongator complex protein 2 n=1 Tax=Gnathostoma spinigerum TaxID=75299 RepID=A0ABD6E397_9BILA
MVKISTTFIAKGCAQRPHSIVWSRRLDVILFASSGDICFAVPKKHEQPSRILSTKFAHPASIITYLQLGAWTEKSTSYENYDLLVSGGADGSIGIWMIHKSIEDCLESSVQQLYYWMDNASPKLPVTCCAAAIDVDSSSSVQLTFVFSSSSPFLCVQWSAVTDQSLVVLNICQLNYGSTLILCTELHRLANGLLLLAVGTSDFNVDLYYESSDHKNFITGLSLHGHQDWITSLAFKEDEGGLFLASAGQDKVVRIWRFDDTQESKTNESGDSVLESRSLSFCMPAAESAQIMKVSLETILSGHEESVNSVSWHPTKDQILTASNDKCVIIWEPTEDGDGIWLEKARMGDVGGQAVGFFGACFSPTGNSILANTYFGGFVMWNRSLDISEADEDIWSLSAAIGGHFCQVCDMTWDPSGSYILSCSKDQTTRCFAPTLEGYYAEIARPQVHGHDLNCIASISTSCFVSGAEEKIFRAFRAPKAFAYSLAYITGYPFEKLFSNSSLENFGAAVPALGLSNKGIEQDDSEEAPQTKQRIDEEVISCQSHPSVLNAKPSEYHLMQNTLWPEVHKLYGHGFEVFSVASNHSGSLIATACKASQSEHAVILIWDTVEWLSRCQLLAHNLTVTQMSFSPNDVFLLSVSRDRTINLFSSSEEDKFCWKKISIPAELTRVHSRIIWTCGWSGDSNFFITGSRDKKIVVWSLVNGVEKLSVVDKSTEPFAVTALDFCPKMVQDNYVLAVGLESGHINIFSWKPGGGFSVLVSLDQSLAHSQVVRRLRFRPIPGKWSAKANANPLVFELASASNDNALKVYRLEF